MAYTTPDTFAAGWNDALDRRKPAGFSHDYHVGHVAGLKAFPGNAPAPKGQRFNEDAGRGEQFAEAAE